MPVEFNYIPPMGNIQGTGFWKKTPQLGLKKNKEEKIIWLKQWYECAASPNHRFKTLSSYESQGKQPNSLLKQTGNLYHEFTTDIQHLDLRFKQIVMRSGILKDFGALICVFLLYKLDMSRAVVKILVIQDPF